MIFVYVQERFYRKESTASNSSQIVESKKSSTVTVQIGQKVNTTYTRQTTQTSSYSSVLRDTDAIVNRLGALSLSPSSSFSLLDNPHGIRKNSTFNVGKKESDVQCYPTNSSNRGTALIINNIKFHNERLYRRGAKKDENDLAAVFNKIGFKVKRYQDLNSNNLRKKLIKYSKLMTGDICMVIVMSHGTNRECPGGYTEVLCSDGEGISTESVIEYFDEYNNECLKGKPKIFIFQCCRSKLQVDGTQLIPKPSWKSNTLIAYSTIPGFSSYRDSENGTRYIQTLCKVLDEHARDYHIEDLLKIVETKLTQMNDHNEQVSCYENRGFPKKCYLNPI